MIFIDDNNLLCENEIISKDKKYSIKLNWTNFESFDKEIFVRHKKSIKKLNFKDLWDKMEVFYYKEKKEEIFPLDKNAFIQSTRLFNGFNEETGEKYFFLYKYSENDMNKIKNILNKLNIDLSIQKKSYWIIIENNENQELIIPSHKNEILSFLFGLVVFYGNIDISKNVLKNIKINLPLWGQFSHYEESLNIIKEKLAQEGLFISTKVQKNWDINTYQISISDYEILEIMGEWYKNIEKISEINKHTQNKKAVEKLEEFINNDQEFNKLKNKEMKLLTKE